VKQSASNDEIWATKYNERRIKDKKSIDKGCKFWPKGYNLRTKGHKRRKEILQIWNQEASQVYPQDVLKMALPYAFLWFSYLSLRRNVYLCHWLLDVCYTDAYKHFATLKHQAHASSCKSMNVSFEEVK
jgi:hypothetical protein